MSRLMYYGAWGCAIMAVFTIDLPDKTRLQRLGFVGALMMVASLFVILVVISSSIQ